MSRVAYPNQITSATIQIFGSGGIEITGVLSNASLQIDSETPLTATVNGMVLSATIPNTHALGDFTFTWTWTQVANLYGTGPITSVEQASYAVTIIAQPSGSSQSFVPTNYVRQCRRLAEPADTTVEQINGGNLTVYADVPYSLLRCVASNLPSSGPDVVSFSYVDTQGQAGTLSFNCWLWMSDNAYILVSADNGIQFAVASVNGNFFDANAQAINTRNTDGGTQPLMPCANASRYDWPALLPNQVLPTVFYYDGVLLGGGSSSSSG